ncbi:AfsR/SARP family transcriptional regulator [Streptomyces liangshanensis]|uniref:AfsR/SARP family transcriptional regulator n=1 Tax=Streptomyces liangshanensis TaxID=2717324 RepID=UPI0036D81F24
MREQVRFSVLGPVRAWRGAEEIGLGPAQQRAVLAVLLLAEGSQVVTSGLVDAVWGTRPPASAVGILRTYVHGLRRALEPGEEIATSVIRYTGDGYQLRVPPGRLDLHAFREFLARADEARCAGDAAGAAELLRRGLDLWQGTPLAGVRGEYARGQRQRLDELRLSARAARLTAELDCGAPAKAASELAGLVAEHPLDERFRELLMLALYRSGRQAAALETYREARTVLVEELGVDPGPALREMYKRVLRADSELLGPPGQARPVPAPDISVPAQLPAGMPMFVGRDAELAEVSALPSGGTVVISAIAGMAGVGKTAFAVHWARQIADRFPDGQLYLNLRGFDPAGVPVPPEHALRVLLESLGTDPRGLPQDIDVLIGLYRTRLAGRRVLVLLDNARDAAQVRPLLPGAPGCLVVVTSRNRLSGLIALDGAHLQDLDVLSPAEARELLARRLGEQRVAAEPEAVEEIIAWCARLPLALAITAARAAVRPAFPLAAIAAELRAGAEGLDAFHDGDETADVRAVFSWSYLALSPDAARLFRLLALHPGPDIAPAAVASLAGLTPRRTGQLLGELVQAHLTDEIAPGRYASHDLVRAYATELAETVETPSHLHEARHRMFDHYLHTAHGAVALTSERVLIALAPAAEGVRGEEFAGDPARAQAWLDAEQAALLAIAEQAVNGRYDVHAWQLAWALSNQLHRLGLAREQEAVNRAAMEAAHRLGDLSAQAHAHRSLGVVALDLGRFDQARGHAERATELFAEAHDMSGRAQSYRLLAVIAERVGDLEAGLDAAQRSLALFRSHENRGGDTRRGRAMTASALNAVGWFHVLLGQPRQALDHCRQALARYQELGHDVGASDTWDSIGFALHRLGRYDEALVVYRDALSLYQRTGRSDWFVVGTLMRLGDTHLSAGQPAAARAVWSEGLHIMERLVHTDVERLAERLRARLRDLDGPSGPATADAAVVARREGGGQA